MFPIEAFKPGGMIPMQPDEDLGDDKHEAQVGALVGGRAPIDIPA
jgi:hypothetical protein